MNFPKPIQLASLAALSSLTILCAPASAQQFDAPERLAKAAFELGIHSCVALDVDEDGDLDVISTSLKTPGLRWIEQTGLNSRNFQLAGTIGTLPNTTRRLTAEDLDGDGRADLIVVLPSPDEVHVLWNDGGSFSPEQQLSTGPHVPYQTAFADVDGDGDLDIVLPISGTTTLPEQLTWIENLGARQFAARSPFPGIDAEPTQAITGDVDGDGDDDLITYSFQNRIRFYRRTASGFAPPETIGGITINAFVNLEGLTDLDQDGDLDLHLTSSGAQNNLVAFAVPFRSALGAFGLAAEVPGTTGSSLALDITGDGIPDIVGQGASAPRTFVRGLGGVQFGGSEPLDPATGPMERFLLSADLDADGALDLFSFGEGGFAWRAGEPSASGPALEPDARSILALLSRGNAAAALDLDADGTLDLAVASETHGLLRIENNGFGSVGELTPLSTADAPVVAESLQSIDVDGDGRLDLVLRLSDGGYQWRRGLASGALEPADGILSLVGNDRQPQFVDMDGDGDLDLVDRSPAAGTVRWWQQEPTGTFKSAAALATLPTSADLASVGDIDGDGIPDLVVAVRLSLTRTRVRWFRGLGGAQLAPGITVATLQAALARLRCLDLSGDGLGEIYWAQGDQTTYTVTSFDPAASAFDPPAAFPQWELQDTLHAQDFDADGTTDLLLISRSGSRVRLRRGLGGLSFGGIETVATPPGFYRSYEVADLDSDGDLDLVLTLGTGAFSTSSPTSIFLMRNRAVDSPGAPFCGPAQPNSTGTSASISGSGSGFAAENSLSLRAMALPPGSATLFLTSLTAGFVSQPGGSAGDLCLGGSIGRFAGPGQVQVASVQGTAVLGLDLTGLPQPTSSVAAMAGETWHFQAWFRDAVAGQATSNFTDGLALTLQ